MAKVAAHTNDNRIATDTPWGNPGRVPGMVRDGRAHPLELARIARALGDPAAIGSTLPPSPPRNSLRDDPQPVAGRGATTGQPFHLGAVIAATLIGWAIVGALALLAYAIAGGGL